MSSRALNRCWWYGRAEAWRELDAVLPVGARLETAVKTRPVSLASNWMVPSR